MERTNALHLYSELAVEFPERAVFFRLGGNLHHTELSAEDAEAYRRSAQRAFELCRPTGRWRLVAVEQKTENGFFLEDGQFLESRDFASLCETAKYLWCGAVTVGQAVVTARDETPLVSERVVIDAVGSETAEAAMELLHRMAIRELRPTGLLLGERRFSAGYGDMALKMQRITDHFLDLSAMGVTLSDTFVMSPEKSVTAWAILG